MEWCGAVALCLSSLGIENVLHVKAEIVFRDHFKSLYANLHLIQRWIKREAARQYIMKFSLFDCAGVDDLFKGAVESGK